MDTVEMTHPLQREIAELQQRLAVAERRALLAETVILQMPVCASIWHLEQPDEPHSLRLIISNPASNLVAGFDLVAEIGRTMPQIFPTMKEELFQNYAAVLRSGVPRELGYVEYSHERAGTRIVAMQIIPLSHDTLLVLGEDVTERKRSEQAIRQTIAQEETIRAQSAMLAELSTPLIPISDRVVVMPLIGSVDSRRAQQVIETLLQGIASSRSHVAILDITGVPVVDTQVANALVRAAQAVKLLGAQVVLSGIRPEVAQTLVSLGVDLSGIVTRGSLQSGIAYAIARN